MDKETSVLHSLELIENCISEKLTVENIAHGVYFSKYHFQRIFREIIGDSVMEYVTKRKLTLAGRALLDSDASILDIALNYGYDSREGFTRSFKAYMGVSPKEYRKYGLTAISQKDVKERSKMTYSKTTDEIIRELNNFIVKAKDTANASRKCEVTEYIPFWNVISSATDKYADRTKDVLNRITAIAEHPDEIINRFSIVKVLDDIAFQSNLIAFNVGLTISRGKPEHITLQKALCDKYLELARMASLKSAKITGFFNELSTLIFDDMRQSAVERLNTIIDAGKTAVDGITGYDYIKDEITNILDSLSVPAEEVTVNLLEECQFKLSIISIAFEIDICRNPQDKAMLKSLIKLNDSVSEATEFFKTLVMPESNPIMERPVRERLLDIVYQVNVLLFYTRGEIEKLSFVISAKQKESLLPICVKIDEFVRFAHSAFDDIKTEQIVEMLSAIHSDMTAKSDYLNEFGGPFKFIANELKNLTKAVPKWLE
ncbi:MAG: AraC family transcriptional regulator [Oscillospiraceae bacterium]|nr:AraC family transcriptional regulator [Oscillospiraceae bacterium]